MNRDDVSKLLNLIRSLSPAFTITPRSEDTPGTGDTWAQLLADIPAADAIAAVRTHFATGGPWINVSDIRRRVLAARGLLPPDTEAAYAQARRMNTWLDRRVGPEPAIHPAAMAAAREIGWSTFDGLEGYAHKRFAESYNPISTRDAEKALTTALPVLVAAVNAPKALPAGSGVEAAQRETQAAQPTDRARAAAIVAQIRRSGFGRTVPTESHA